MDTGRIGHFTDNFPLVHIQDLDARRAADVQAPGLGIERDVVPAAVSADLDFLENMVGWVGCPGRAAPCCQQSEEANQQASKSSEGNHGEALLQRMLRLRKGENPQGRYLPILS